MTFKVNVSRIPVLTKKFGKDNIGKIRKELESEELNLKQFQEIIFQRYSWCGGVFRHNYVKKTNFIETHILGLDFDDQGLTIEEAKQIFKEYGINPNLEYFTISHTPEEPRFRIVFLFDVPIKNIFLYEEIYKKLLNILKCADKNCKDVTRIFFAGTGVTLLSEEPVSLERFVEFLSIKTIEKDYNKTRGISKLEQLLANNVPEPHLLYNNYRSNGFETDSPPKTTSVSRPLSTTKIDWQKALETVRVFREFAEGTKLSHHQLFGIATNLIHIEGGVKFMKEAIQTHNGTGLTDYNPDKFAMISYVHSKGYHPMPVKEFSPYEEDNFIFDIVSEVQWPRGQIRKLEHLKTVTIAEAERYMKESFEKALNSEEIGINIIDIVTGLGKTHMLLNVEGQLIAFPTNNLKNEVHERMIVPAKVSPDPITFSPIKRQVNYFHRIGLPKKAFEVIKDAAKFDSEAADYLRDLEVSTTTKDSVLTTHSRAINTDAYDHKNLIFDEDPLQYLIPIDSTNLDEIKGLTLIYQPFREMIEKVTEAGDGIFPTPTTRAKIEDFEEKFSSKDLKFSSNIFNFFFSNFYINNGGKITYITKKGLPPYKNITILSATASKKLYEYLYSNMKPKFYSVGNVEMEGRVKQFSHRSCSRDGLEKYGSIINSILGNLPVLTFKAFKDMFSNADKKIHFGNTSGYDIYRGRDIAVVGTPHRNINEVFLIGKLCGFEFNIEKEKFSYQLVKDGNFEYKLNTFINPDLRMIHLELMKGDITQAVGRARPVRENCNVYLFSSLPCEMTTEFITEDYIKNPEIFNKHRY